MKFPPFNVTKQIMVDHDPRTGEAILTVIPELFDLAGRAPTTLTLRLSPSAKALLLASLRAPEITQDSPNEKSNKPDSLQ